MNHEETNREHARNEQTGNEYQGGAQSVPTENVNPATEQHPPRSNVGRPLDPNIQPDAATPGSFVGQSAGQSTEYSAGQGVNQGASQTQRTTQAAREQAGVAADALRRGQFMQDATVDGSANNDDKLIALLSYVTQVFIPVVMPIIVLLSDSSKKRPFQRYHAVQSLALTLLFIVVAIAASLGALIIQIVPVVGQLVALLLFCLSPIAYLMAVVAMFYYGYQAYQGKRFAIPGLTTFLRDQGWLS